MSPHPASEFINTVLDLFIGSDNETPTTATFPNAITPFERDYVLARVSKLKGVNWKIIRRREKEFVILQKNACQTSNPMPFNLSQTSRESMISLMWKKENGRSDSAGQKPKGLMKHNTFQGKSFLGNDDLDYINTGGCGNRLHINYPTQVPKKRFSDEFAQHRQSLPIWSKREKILEFVSSRRITVIMGSSGSGKSTQVPQFILDSATANEKPASILSCEPNRLSAIANCDCIARERGERVGITIGYQARLESCYSPCASALLFSTNELFLRSLIPPAFPILQNFTHIILDEFHIRDSRSDFALTCLLSLMKGFKFNLILMCGEMDAEALLEHLGKFYFEDLGLILVESKTDYVPRIFHLNEVELMMGKQKRHREAGAGCDQSKSGSSDQVVKFQSSLDNVQELCKCCNLVRSEHLANVLLQRYIFSDDVNAAEEFIHLVLRHEISVDAVHQNSGMTFLMAAAAKGSLHYMRCLLKMGANTNIFAKNGMSLLGITNAFREHRSMNLINRESASPYMVIPAREINPVNLKFIFGIILFIHTNFPATETVLVFLSSYDEIVTLKEMLFLGYSQLDPQSFVVSLLHINIPCGDERIIFDEPPSGIRKIILTTDVADIVSVKDAVHVIDAGYTEEKSYNATKRATGTRKVLISKSSATERVRKNTFRLYNREIYESMSPFRPPEITQSPLQELCLYSTSLLKGNDVVADFFDQFLTPPPAISLVRSFQDLMEIGALDNNRKMTPLGSYLLDFPVEPRFGKALIYAAILRCLDPVLTIVATLSHRDPFITPPDVDTMVKIRNRKEVLSKNTYSDHMAMLQAFLDWENEAGGQTNADSLTLNYVSPGTFDMVCAIRTDLLGQLRAFGFVRCKGIGNIKDLNHNSFNWSVVKAVLIAALYPNVMKINRLDCSLSNNEFKTARFHPSSCIPLKQPPSSWCIYDEINQTNVLDLCKGCTLVSAFSLLVFGGSPTEELAIEASGIVEAIDDQGQPHNEEIHLVRLNDWIAFQGLRKDVELVLTIRRKFQHLVEKQLRKPGTLLTPAEDKDLQTLTLILTTEDRAAGLSQIDGIGQWPRFAGGSLLSVPCQGFRSSLTDSNVRRKED